MPATTPAQPNKAPFTKADDTHPLMPAIIAALCTVYDPEIPVNLYELGLIYQITVAEKNDLHIEMTLTTPGCPVAVEMPGKVEQAVTSVPKIGAITVTLVWDPPWTPDMMTEEARLQLDMF